MVSSSPTDAELATRIRQQEVVADLGQRALETADLDQLLADAAVAVARTLETDACGAFEVRPDAREAALRAGVGWPAGLVGEATVPTDRDSQVGYTLLTDTPVIVSDLQTDERFPAAEVLTDHDAASAITATIGSPDDPWGVLETHTTDPREFTDHDATFLQSVVNVLAAAIDRTEKEKRLRERETQLERYKEYTDEILNAVDDLFYVVDETGTFQRWNETLNTVTGYSDAEIESMQPLEFIVEEDREAVANGIAEIFETGSSQVEADVLTKDGERIPYEFVAVRLENPEGEHVLAGIGRNIRDRKERERELAKYETIVETINDGIYVKDEDGRFTMVNDAYAELTGYDRAELMGEHASLVVDETAIEQSREVLTAPADEETENSATEAEIQTADGDRIPAEGTFATLQTPDGEHEEVGVVRDISDRKERERELRRKERRYEAIFEDPNILVGLLEPDGTVLDINRTAMEYIEADLAAVTGEPFWETPWWGEGDGIQDEVKAWTDRAAAGEYVDFQADLTRPDGQQYTLEGAFRPVTNDDGEVVSIIVSDRDVTERKRNERELEESERRYRTLVEHFPNGLVTLFDHDLRYELAAGQAFEDIPIAPEELEGHHFSDVWDDETADALRPAFEAALNGNEQSIELGYEGREWVVHAVPITDDHGDVFAGMTMAQDITERKQRERRLERYETIVEAVNDGVYVVDEEGAFQVVNETYTEMLGYSPDELVGVDASTVVDNTVIDRVDELHVAAAEGHVEHPSMEAELRTADGGRLPVEATFAPLPEGDSEWHRVGVVRDISERKERERAIEESKRRYRALVENFPNGLVALFDEDLRYTAAGGQLFERLDFDPEDRIGHSFTELHPPDLVEELEPYFQAALAGETNSFEIEFYDRHLYANTLPVKNATDEVFAGMLVIQDVTERREYERKLEASNERLEQFAYAASHDLQEPLRMVSSYLQLIERRYEDALDEEGQEFLEFAVDGADRMREMIEGLLEYSRVDTRGDPFEAVDLESVLADVRDDLQMRIEKTDAEITAGELPRVEGDPGQLRQLVQNLLSNAIEYSGDAPPRVHVTAERDGEKWLVSVADEGIGIDPADQERIFEVFQSLHTPEDHSGTGIGLALCERIAERHGGEIWVDSDPGEGATFTFTLPADGEHDE